MNEKAFCRACGEEIFEEAEICPKCGVRQRQNNVKSPGIAAIASFFWTGLGQIYNGQIAKGFLFMFIEFINILLISVAVGLITFPLFWVYGIYDAYKTAEKINNNSV